MKYYGSGSLSSLLKVTLDALILIGIGMFIILSKSTLIRDYSKANLSQTIFIYGVFFIGSISLILVVYNLRKIIKSLVDFNPFVMDNVKALKNISIQCFVIAIAYFVNFFIGRKYIDFQLIYIDGKGIHTDMEFFIFFFSGCFILVLSKVFQQAVRVKEENDFTI